MRKQQAGPLGLVETLSLGLFVGALTNACQEYIEQMTTPATLPDEIARFRQKALRCIESAVGEGIAIEDEADAMRHAREHIDHLCDEWLGKGGIHRDQA